MDIPLEVEDGEAGVVGGGEFAFRAAVGPVHFDGGCEGGGLAEVSHGRRVAKTPPRWRPGRCAAKRGRRPRGRRGRGGEGEENFGF